MPRFARAAPGGYCYHVLNRGNGRQQVFFEDPDYAAFCKAMVHAGEQVDMRVLAWCLMPNHFHFVVWPREDGDLSRWMHWLCNAHVRRYHRHYRGSGHLWQGRFKSFPIELDDHLLRVLRYVERNPCRAGLVEKPEDWAWSSLAADPSQPLLRLDAGPVARPPDWRSWVAAPTTSAEVEAIRRAVDRGSPYGSESWQRVAAAGLGLEATLRPRTAEETGRDEQTLRRRIGFRHPSVRFREKMNVPWYVV